MSNKQSKSNFQVFDRALERLTDIKQLLYNLPDQPNVSDIEYSEIERIIELLKIKIQLVQVLDLRHNLGNLDYALDNLLFLTRTASNLTKRNF